MRTKNFFICGIAGAIVDFLLGWLFYGTLFTDHFPTGGNENILLLFLGSLSFGLLISYIFTNIGNIISTVSGLMTGAVLGLLLGLTKAFFSNAMGAPINYETTSLDVVLSVVITAIVGAVVATVNGKLK